MQKMFAITLGLSLSGWLAQAADNETKPEAKPAVPTTREEIIKKYDKNGDGRLDQEERAALRKDREAEMLKKYDKNGDGKLDENERQAMREDLRKQALARRQAQQKKQEEAKPEEKKEQKKEEKK